VAAAFTRLYDGDRALQRVQVELRFPAE